MDGVIPQPILRFEGIFIDEAEGQSGLQQCDKVLLKDRPTAVERDWPFVAQWLQCVPAGLNTQSFCSRIVFLCFV
jgi:hypothetical protein